MTSTETSEPKLGKPGAGIPWISRMVAKHFILPRYYKKTSWESATGIFRAEAQKILKITESLPVESRLKRVLVPPMQGLEDSSRYWSVAMTMEHLVIVSSGILGIIIDLTNGKPTNHVVSTADVKPRGLESAEESMAAFSRLIEEYSNRTTNETRDRKSALKQAHPWFGPMTAHQWHCLAASHMHIHRKQIEAIVRGL